MKNCILYEIEVAKSKRVYNLVLFLLFCIFFTVVALLPLKDGIIGQYGLAPGVSIEPFLVRYQERLDLINSYIEQGMDVNQFKKELSLLNLYLSTSTCEYDYIAFDSCFTLTLRAEHYAYATSLLQGGLFFSLILASYLASSNVIRPISRNETRNMVQIGVKRSDIYKAKTGINVLLITLYSLLLYVVALIVAKDDLHILVRSFYKDEVLLFNFFEMLSSMAIGIFINTLFFYFFITALGLMFKRSDFPIFIASILFIFCFLFASVSPKWGVYNELVDEQLLRIYLIPFSNVVIACSQGFIYENLIMLSFYFGVSISLYFITIKQFKNISL